MSILKTLDFETGDLSQFDSVDDANNNLSVIAAAKAPGGGSYGLAWAFDGTTAARHGTVTGLSGLTAVYRARIDLSAGTLTGPELGASQRSISMLIGGATGVEVSLEGGPGAVGADDEFEIYVNALGGTPAKVPVNAGWHRIEVRVDVAGAEVKAWVDKPSNETPDAVVSDGTPPASATTLGVGPNQAIQSYLNGQQIYADNVVISDDDTPLVSLPYPTGRYNLNDHVRMSFGAPLTAPGNGEAFNVDGMRGPYQVQALFDVAGAANEYAVDGTTDGVTYHEIATLLPGASDAAGLITVDAGPWRALRPRLVALDAGASSVEFGGLAQV